MVIKPINVLILSVFLLFINQSVIAQVKDIKFDHMTVDEGLPSNTINGVIRDSRGFIWIATENGVSRYDGYHFENFRANEGDTKSISSNLTYAVFEDKQQRLWVGSENGLDLLNRKSDRFDKHFFKGIPIRSIYQDKNLTLWVGTDKGLYAYHEQTKNFDKPFGNLFDAKNDRYNTIPSIIEDYHGNLWIGTSNNGVYVYDIEAKIFAVYLHDENKTGTLSNNNVRKIIEDHNHNIWIATYGGGLNLFEPETKTFKAFTSRLDDPNGISTNLIPTLWEDSKGMIWIGTDGKGIDIFDYKKNVFHHVVHSPYNSKSLNNNVVRSISSDGRGGIWIGTYAGGVNFYNQHTEAFFHYKVPTYNGNNSVTSFAEEKNGNLWIGVDGGGLCYFNRATGQFLNFIHDEKNVNSLSDDRVISLVLDHQGLLWIGTYLGGLCTYNPKTKSFRRYTDHDRSKLTDNVIWALLEDDQNRIWVGTNRGLNLYHRENDTFSCFDITNSNLSNSMIRCIFQDHKKRLWIGTQAGLNIMNRNNDGFIVIKSDPDKNSLSNHWIRTINEDKLGNIWVGTFEGLNLLDEKAGMFVSFKESDGLPDNIVSGILADDTNNIWISTGRGLAWFDLPEKKIKIYNVNDGLQDKQFNINASFMTQHGEFLFGGNNGFTLFLPDVIKHAKSNNFPPPLAITGLKIFNKEVLPAQNSPLANPINETKLITLPYDQTVLTFEFAALNFIQPENNQYAYRLLGFEDDWNYVGVKRSATYTNLEPGDYAFQVKASNNDGVWNNKGISLSLSIEPPFWGTWWFKLVIIIVISSLALWILNIIRNRIREKIRINKLIAELEIKALIAQMNPHFIFNCLTSIQELIMANKQEEAMHYLNQFSKLLRTVLNSSEKNFIPLELELTLLELYLELEAMRFDNQFHYKISVDEAIDPEEVNIPSFLIQPFVENALWHGLMHKKGDRNLNISFTLETEDLLVCKIEDNGVGRDVATRFRRKSIKAPYQSMGIKIIRERISLMKKQNDAVDLNIIDVLDSSNGLAAGTTVIIKLPLKHDDASEETVFNETQERMLVQDVQN
jgi:ligand-binding sensor domain-containing protein